MEQDKVNLYLMLNGKYYPEEQLSFIQEQLQVMDEASFSRLAVVDKKDPLIVLIISILVGSLGIDRFYIGQIGLGVLKLLTCGGFGIWTIVDLFLIMRATKEENFNKLLPWL